MSPRRHRLLLASVLALACSGGIPDGEVRPLLDDLHAPLILTESAQLEKPPSYSGNRFLRGWWPGERSADPSQINVGDRPVLEAVFLDGRERRLSTRLQILEAEPGATFGVRIAGRELPSQPLVADLEVPLPPNLPLGRLSIQLDLRGSKVEIQAAGFGHAWPAGEIDLDAEVITQGGYSALDFPRRLAAPATLVGSFEPPAAPEPDQRFSVLVSGADGEVAAELTWQPGDRRDPLRPIRLDLPAGFVRVRLLAQGLGPAGRWHGLGLVGGNDDQPPRFGTVEGRAGVAQVAASSRYELVRVPSLGLADDVASSRDAEYLFDLRQEPGARRNLAGVSAVEIDWLRSRLEHRIASRPAP